MTDRPRNRPPPRPLADDVDETAIDETVADRTTVDATVADETVADRPMVDATVADRTTVDDTVADRTTVDEERTVADESAVEAVARRDARKDRGGGARRTRHEPRRAREPRPVPADEVETVVSPPPDGGLPTADDFRRLGRLIAALAVQVVDWLGRRVVRPGIRGAEVGLRRVIELFRPSRPEDSDAYSRRRGQQWRRFREGDPSINELREFDHEFRKREKDRDS